MFINMCTFLYTRLHRCLYTCVMKSQPVPTSVHMSAWMPMQTSDGTTGLRCPTSTQPTSTNLAMKARKPVIAQRTEHRWVYICLYLLGNTLLCQVESVAGNLLRH